MGKVKVNRRKMKLNCPVPYCQTLMTVPSLLVHLARVHTYDKSKIDEWKESAFPTVKGKFPCFYCEKVLVSLRSMRDHVRTKHKEVSIPQRRPKKSVTTLKCPICAEWFPTQVKFAEHYTDHLPKEERSQFEIIGRHFDNREMYTKWITKKCKKSNTRFRSCGASAEADDGENISEPSTSKIKPHTKYFKCATVVGTRQSKHLFRLCRTASSSVAACTAHGKLTTNSDGSVIFEGCFGHVHCPDILRMLTNEEKEILFSLMKQGNNDDNIIEKMRSEYDPRQRLYHVSLSDLRTVRQEGTKEMGRKHEDDFQSIKVRFQENKPEEGLHYLLMPIDEKGKDVRLVIMTPIQVGWLRKYGSEVLLVNNTKKITKYKLNLTSLLVVDEAGRGLPAGFCISQETSGEELDELFCQIKEAFPEFCPRYVVTDENDRVWNSYRRVFKKSSSKRLTCRSEQYTKWRAEIAHFVKNKVPTEYYIFLEKLAKLVREPKEKQFREIAEDLLCYMDDYEDLKEASAALRKSIMPIKKKDWPSFQPAREEPIRTVYCDIWQSLLNRFLKGLYGTMRLDSLVEVLLYKVEWLERGNKANERYLIREKKKYSNEEVHANAVEFYKEAKDHLKINERGWLIEPHGEQKSAITVIKKLDSCTCRNVQEMHCSLCDACPTVLVCDSCSCRDKSRACVHLHAVKIQQAETERLKNVKVDCRKKWNEVEWMMNATDLAVRKVISTDPEKANEFVKAIHSALEQASKPLLEAAGPLEDRMVLPNLHPADEESPPHSKKAAKRDLLECKKEIKEEHRELIPLSEQTGEKRMRLEDRAIPAVALLGKGSEGDNGNGHGSPPPRRSGRIIVNLRTPSGVLLTPKHPIIIPFPL